MITVDQWQLDIDQVPMSDGWPVEAGGHWTIRQVRLYLAFLQWKYLSPWQPE